MGNDCPHLPSAPRRVPVVPRVLQLAAGQEPSACQARSVLHVASPSMLRLRSTACLRASLVAGSNRCSRATPQGERLYYTVKRPPGGQVGEGNAAFAP